MSRSRRRLPSLLVNTRSILLLDFRVAWKFTATVSGTSKAASRRRPASGAAVDRSTELSERGRWLSKNRLNSL